MELLAVFRCGRQRSATYALKVFGHVRDVVGCGEDLGHAVAFEVAQLNRHVVERAEDGVVRLI